MSLESSRERKEQEQPKPTTAAETDRSPVVQGDSGGEQLPANITSRSVLPDFDDLVVLLQSWILTPDWPTSQTYLQAHPELLREAAEQVLATLAQHQPDPQVRERLTQYQLLLQIARQHGVESAYELLLQRGDEAESASNDLEELANQLIAWIQMPDWDASQTYLQAHPQLLTERAEQLLEQLKHAQSEEDGRSLVQHRLALLHQARTWEIAGVYAYFQLAEPAALIDDHQREVLLRPLEEWLTMHDRKQSQIYLEEHPSLLTKVAESLLAGLWLMSPAYQRQIIIAFHLQLLQRARAYGITTAYHGLPDAATLNELGIEALQEYWKSGGMGSLEQALECWQQALFLTLPDSPDRLNYLINMGAVLHDLYKHTGKMKDLERAIIICQQAVDAAPPNSPNRSTYLTNLGTVLHERSWRIGEMKDLERVIIICQQAVDAAPPNSPSRSTYLTNLGIGLREHSERIGEMKDLERAIINFQQAVDAAPPNSPNRSMYLTNLGTGLRNRYMRTGKLEDLERAIINFQQAVDALPPNSPDRPINLRNLGLGLRNRYARTEEMKDLERAITVFQQAVDAASPNSDEWPGLLTNLGNGLRDRYTRTGKLEDLERAIDICQQAVDATPPNFPDRSIRLANLGNGLRDLYKYTEEMKDLERAIDIYQQAVDAAPSSSPSWLDYLTNLGAGVRDRYARTREMKDLERAIDIYQQAVDAASPNSPNRSTYLTNLGNGLRDRYACTRALVDLEKVITTWEANWSLLHLRFVALPVAYQLGQQRQGVLISASLVTAHLERSARHRPNARIDRCRALEVAEGSKSRLLTQMIGRGPLPLPPGLLPEVAAREQHLLSELTDLDTLELTTHGQSATANEAGNLNRLQQRQADLGELEDLWDDIARLDPDGTEYVALRRGAVPTWQELTDLAQELGRATALLSFFTTPDHVLLFLVRAGQRGPCVSRAPLNRTGWDNLLERFFREVHRYAPGLRRGETWDQALYPLLIQMQRHLTGIERLILAPAGNGHLLPWSVLMERVGWRTSADQPLPLVTLPALGVLSRLRRRPQAHIGPALVVGNPTGDLPYAEDEAKEVAVRFGTSPLLGGAATKEAVLSRLAEASLIHLATHAFFDLNNPLESGIVLANSILTAREVLQHRLHADLLVLSACESGQVSSLGGEELAGLSQAFLQAGVRSLLVSLWRVNDLVTAALMQAFYTARQAGADKALALRQAMTQIQQDPRWTHPYYWGAFVLMGDWD